MVARGRVKNGVVVLDEGVRLPEGAAVTVLPEPGVTESELGVPRDRMTEDELKRLSERLQKLTDSHIGQVDEIAKRKEQEVLEV